MEKKYEEDELDKLTDEEIDELIDDIYIKEAQIMEDDLFSDKELEDYEASDEEIKTSYQQLVNRLKEDGIYRGDKDDMASRSARPNKAIPFPAAQEDSAYIPNTAEKVVPMPQKRRAASYHKIVKIAGFVLVSGMCVFAASMTSEANRNYFVDSIKILSGDDTRVVVDNDGRNESANIDEYEAIENIKEELGVDMPEFLYRPQPFEFYKYEVNSYVKLGKIEYLHNDVIIEFGIDKEDETTSSKFRSIHGEVLEKVTIKSENIDVVIRKIQDSQDEFPSYLAQWEKNGVFYYILGKIDLNELLKMVEEIRY